MGHRRHGTGQRQRGAVARSWTDRAQIVFPLMSFAAAALTLAAETPTFWIVGLLAVAMLPWALLVGGVRVPAWAVTVLVCVPMVLLTASGALGAVFLGMALVVWLCASNQARWLAWAATAATVFASFNGMGNHEDMRIVEGPIYFAAGALFSLLMGELLRRERRLTAELALAQRDLADAATERERARIAREIHDVIGHALTVVQLHVAGARRQLRTDPRAADTTLARAEDLGRESLDNLRQVVGLLRSTDGGSSGAAAPQPTARDLPALVEAAREAGLDASLEVDGDLARVDATSGLAAYRVVQESLANARHHAPGASVDVQVRVRRCSVDVRVVNAAPRHPVRLAGREGTGITGMRERVHALHGTIDAGPSPDGGWAVEFSLPKGVV